MKLNFKCVAIDFRVSPCVNIYFICFQVGGVETATLGDAEAKGRNCRKTILERRAPPTFDFVVEMRERDYWVTHQV